MERKKKRNWSNKQIDLKKNNIQNIYRKEKNIKIDFLSFLFHPRIDPQQHMYQTPYFNFSFYFFQSLTDTNQIIFHGERFFFPSPQMFILRNPRSLSLSHSSLMIVLFYLLLLYIYGSNSTHIQNKIQLGFLSVMCAKKKKKKFENKV